MPTNETPGGRGASVLTGLLAPLRLPERMLEALDELRPMREELTRVREQTQPLGGLLPALERLEQALAPVDGRLDAIERAILDLAGEVQRLHQTLVTVKDDLQRLPGIRADSEDRSMMERARDVLTGNSGDEDDDAEGPAAARP